MRLRSVTECKGAIRTFSRRPWDGISSPSFIPSSLPKTLALGVHDLTDCQKEFPASWFAHAKLSPRGRDCSLNYFGVDASQPLSMWRKKGWIHSDDPRGWFQWYCRYYMGRRMSDDNPLSTLQKQFACARLSRSCLPGSLSRRFRDAHHHGF
jgi:hypothetical protein